MSDLLSIGEFARLTHLSVKALRHYDDVGLLRPADIDSSSGYRRYAIAQVPTAQVIRRFRDLDMSLERIGAVLSATDTAERDEVIVQHLREMEAKLDQTQASVASLRELLEPARPAGDVTVREVPPTPVVAVRARVEWDDTEAWLAAALADAHDVADRDGLGVSAADGALYSEEFFELHEGEVVAFVPVSSGGNELLPARRLAVMTHRSRLSTGPMPRSAPT